MPFAGTFLGRRLETLCEFGEEPKILHRKVSYTNAEQVRRHGLPPVSHGAWWLQGLKETTGWQAGGAMEDVLPETLGDGLMGKEVRHPEPS